METNTLLVFVMRDRGGLFWLSRKVMNYKYCQGRWTLGVTRRAALETFHFQTNQETFCPCVCLLSVWPSSTFRVFCILDPNSRGIGFEV